jgi:Zn-dependent alcohol dehydrogenase
MTHTANKLINTEQFSDQLRRRGIDVAGRRCLDIGSMVSRHISLDEVNDAFRAMEAGEVIRSVIT